MFEHRNFATISKVFTNLVVGTVCMHLRFLAWLHDCHLFSSILQRKFEAAELDEDIEATISETEVLWRANFQKFVFCLKKKVLILLYYVLYVICSAIL